MDSNTDPKISQTEALIVIVCGFLMAILLIICQKRKHARIDTARIIEKEDLTLEMLEVVTEKQVD